MKINYILLYVTDLHKTADFYKKLGFDVVENTEAFIIAKLGDISLLCHDQSKVFFKQDVERHKGGGVYFHIQVPNVDEVYESLKGKGLEPSSPPKDWEWGNREFAIKDPDGYKFVFYKKL